MYLGQSQKSIPVYDLKTLMKLGKRRNLKSLQHTLILMVSRSISTKVKNKRRMASVVMLKPPLQNYD